MFFCMGRLDNISANVTGIDCLGRVANGDSVTAAVALF